MARIPVLGPGDKVLDKHLPDRLSASGLSASFVATATDGSVASVPAYNVKPATLPRWKKALLSKSAPRLLCVGDSTTLGVISTTTAAGMEGGESSYPGVLRSLIRGFVGDSAYSLGIPQQNTANDGRWTPGSGWGFNQGTLTVGAGGRAYHNAAVGATGSLAYDPGTDDYDTVVVYYAQGPSNPLIPLTINGVAQTAINASGTNGIGRATYTVPKNAGAPIVFGAPTGGTGGQAFILGVETYVAKNGEIRVMNAGVGGTDSSQWVAPYASYSSDVFGGTGMIRALSPDLTVIMFGINDSRRSISVANYTSYITGLVTAARATGDAIIVSCIPSGTDQIGFALEAQYRDALATLATSLGVPFIDVYGRMGSYTKNVSMGFAADPIGHLSANGYADVARAVFATLVAGNRVSGAGRISADIEDPDSDIGAAIARVAAVRPRVTLPIWTPYGDSLARPLMPAVVAIGDSITDNNQTATAWTGSSFSRTIANRADGYLTRAMILLRQRASWYDVGISGQTAAQGLARFDADVTTLKPQVVIEAFGTNDIVASRTADATFADKYAMWVKAWAFGAKVIATNCPPRNTFTTAQAREAQNLNAMLRRFAASCPQNFALVDWYALLANPLADGYQAALVDTAGVHPNSLGALNVAPAFVDALNRFLPPGPDQLPTSNVNDAGNIMPKPLKTGTIGGKSAGFTGPVADGWYGNAGGMTVVGSKAARPDGFGDWQQIDCTGTGTCEVLIDLTSGFAASDVFRCLQEFETDAANWADGALNCAVDCFDAGGASVHHVSSLSTGADTLIQGRMSSGVLATPPFTVPVGTTKMRVTLQKQNAGTVRWGRTDLRALPRS